MDLFDLGEQHMSMLEGIRSSNTWKLEGFNGGRKAEEEEEKAGLCNLTLPDTPYEEQETASSDLLATSPQEAEEAKQSAAVVTAEPPEDLVRGLQALRDTPTLVMGVASDILFPAWQQREVAAALRKVGNRRVTHVELGEDRSLFGHDTFLLDLEGVGGEIRRFLG